MAVCRGAHADQIVVDGMNHVGAKILGLSEGKLRFRTVDGRAQAAWLDEVELIIVDRAGVFNDFNQAEKFFSAQEPRRAIPRYRRSQKLAEGFWPELIAARLLVACDAAGQLDRAATQFVRVLRGRFTGAAAAARLLPESASKKRDAVSVRALEQIEAARSRGPGEAAGLLLDSFRFRILDAWGDPRATEAAGALASRSVPASVRTWHVFALQRRALRIVLDQGVTDESLAALDRAIVEAPHESLADFLLLKGEVLASTAASRDDLIRASWPFMRVAIHFPKSSRMPEALLGAAAILERLERQEKAVELLRECAIHAQLGKETESAVKSALRRIEAESNGSSE